MRPEKRNESKPEHLSEKPEQWLRERLEPPPSQVGRVVRCAFDEERFTPHPFRWGLAGALLSALVMALAFAALALREPAHPRAAEAVRYGAKVPVATITNASGKVELLLPPDWQRPLGPVSPETPHGRPPSGRVRLFNSDGCLAAVLPDGGVRYYIVGGDT